MTEIALSDLHGLADTASVRDEIDPRHAAALAEVLDLTPPIEVVEDGDGYGVLNGYHRWTAAKIRGDETIRARVLEVPREMWLEHALLANSGGAKPLTLSERKRNAERLVLDRPDLSNPRIAAICGLSKDTVAAIRPELLSDEDCSTGDSSGLNTTREGADGRHRPASQAVAVQRREKVADFLRENPEASARQAADAVGVSPATAADVKGRMAEGRPIIPAEEALPAFAIQLPDGTIADAGTPEANAEALRLVSAAQAVSVKHCPTCTCGRESEVA